MSTALEIAIDKHQRNYYREFETLDINKSQKGSHRKLSVECPSLSGTVLQLKRDIRGVQLISKAVLLLVAPFRYIFTSVLISMPQSHRILLISTLLSISVCEESDTDQIRGKKALLDATFLTPGMFVSI